VARVARAIALKRAFIRGNISVNLPFGGFYQFKTNPDKGGRM